MFKNYLNELRTQRFEIFRNIVTEMDVKMESFDHEKYSGLRMLARDFKYSRKEIDDDEITKLKVELYAAKLTFLKDMRCSKYFHLKSVLQCVKDALENSSENLFVTFQSLPQCAKNYIESGKIDLEHFNIQDKCIVPDVNYGGKDFELDSLITHAVNVLISKQMLNAKVGLLVNHALAGFSKHDQARLVQKISNSFTDHEGQISHTLVEHHVKKIANEYLTGNVAFTKEFKAKLEKDTRFKRFQFKILEDAVASRCPLIAAKILPLANLQGKYSSIIENYINPANSPCRQHMTVCLEWAVSEIVCEYRRQECKRALDQELAKIIPNFQYDMLTTIPAKRRYENSTKLGMWVNIQFNAPKICREEGLGRILHSKGINISNLCPESNAEFVNYVLNDCPSQFVYFDAGWPITKNTISCSQRILMLEELRLNRYETALDVLDSLGLKEEYNESKDSEALFIIVSEWTQFESTPLSLLEKDLINYKRERATHFYLNELATKISSDADTIQLFFSIKDANHFTKTLTFKLLCSSSVCFQKLVNGDKEMKFSLVISDIKTIVSKYVKYEISREAVLVVANCLGWD